MNYIIVFCPKCGGYCEQRTNGSYCVTVGCPNYGLWISTGQSHD
jgi:hypothetical protein